MKQANLLGSIQTRQITVQLKKIIKLLSIKALLLSAALLVLSSDMGVAVPWFQTVHAASGPGSDGAEDEAEEDAEEAAEEAAEDAAEEAERAAEEAAEAAEEAAEQAQEQAEQAQEQAELAAEQAEEAAEQAEEAAEQAAEQAEELAERAAEAAEEAAELVDEQLEAAIDAAEEAAELAEEQAEQAIESAEEAAELAEELAEEKAEASEEAAEQAENAAERAEKEAVKATERNLELAERNNQRLEEVESDRMADVLRQPSEVSDESRGQDLAADQSVLSRSDGQAELVNTASQNLGRFDDSNRAEASSASNSTSVASTSTRAASPPSSGVQQSSINSSSSPTTTSLSSSNNSQTVQRVEARQEGIIETDGYIIETEFDQNNHEVVRNELLLLVDTSEFADLEESYSEIERLQDLPSLGKVLAKYYSIEKFNPDEVTEELIAAAPSIEVDRNHVLFEPSTQTDGVIPDISLGHQPGELLSISAANQESVRIGIIDTAVDSSHPWLANARLSTRSFVPENALQPLDHGTAVVSTLIANTSNYNALLPKAEVVSASIFVEQGSQRRITTTEYIAAALEWLLQQNLKVINMSFTGPYSRVLDSLIQNASDQGILLTAAAGNHGPGAAPLYPAAYQGAIAVTAVSAKKRIYRLANRGEHIMFSAPGVDIQHALPGDTNGVSSGTSMASPFVAALLGSRLASEKNPQKVFEETVSSAEDLGKKGRDNTYGYGLIKF